MFWNISECGPECFFLGIPCSVTLVIQWLPEPIHNALTHCDFIKPSDIGISEGQKNEGNFPEDKMNGMPLGQTKLTKIIIIFHILIQKD